MSLHCHKDSCGRVEVADGTTHYSANMTILLIRMMMRRKTMMMRRTMMRMRRMRM